MRQLLFLILICSQSLNLFSQSNFNFDLEDQSTFKDSRRVLSKEDTNSFRPLLRLHGKKQEISIHPLLEASYASDNRIGNIQRWGVGGQLNWNSKKVNMGLSYMYNRGEYMSYRADKINQRRVVPAFGFKSGINSIQSNFWDGYLSYSPNQIFDFEIGYGRKFIGEGHRSLLLSDFTSPYPYLKIETKFWKLTYTNLFSSQLNTFGVVGQNKFYQQKFTASHFLDLQIFKKLSIGLFESVVWQSDEGTYLRGVDPNYLNPVIFYRPVEFSVGSSDNVIIGANITYDVAANHTFYFQALLDEFLLAEIRADVRQRVNEGQDIQSGWWGNKYGLQIGWKGKNLIGIEGLSSRLEYNQLRPYTYAHSNPTQAYTHNSLPLAHPMGANFEELIVQLQYARNKWKWSSQFNQSRSGNSSLGLNFGEDPEVSNQSRIKEYENFIGQGISNHTMYFETFVSHSVKILWGSDVSLGYVWRQNEIKDKTVVNNMIYLSLRTNVIRQRFDY